MATFIVAKPLAKGPASIAIRYRGLINDKLRGFYVSKSERRKYAVTQFEPTDARRAFPSFDEPAFKATYDLTLVVDDGDTAISNAKIAKDEPGPVAGKHTITFERTAEDVDVPRGHAGRRLAMLRGRHGRRFRSASAPRRRRRS